MSEQEQQPSQRFFVLNNEAMPTEFNQPYDQLAFDKTPDGSIQIIGYKSLSEEDLVKAYGYDPEDVPAPQAEPKKLSENPEIAQLQNTIAELSMQVQRLTEELRSLKNEMSADQSADTRQRRNGPMPPEPIPAAGAEYYDVPVRFEWEPGTPVTVKNGNIYQTDWQLETKEPDGRIFVVHKTGSNVDGKIISNEEELSRWKWENLSEPERKEEIKRYDETVPPLQAQPATKVPYETVEKTSYVSQPVEAVAQTETIRTSGQSPGTVEVETVEERQSLRDRLTDNRNRVGIGILGALGLMGVGALLWEFWEHKISGHSPTREARQAITTNTVVPRYDKTFQNNVLGQLSELKRSVRAEISADSAHEAADKARAAADKARDLHAHRHELDAINGVLKAEHRDHAQLLRNLHHGSGFETIGYDGDSVVDDVRRKLTWQLGYNPTTSQTHEATDAVLKINHETWDTIKNKSIGYRYRMPANLVQYISR